MIIASISGTDHIVEYFKHAGGRVRYGFIDNPDGAFGNTLLGACIVIHLQHT